MKTVMRTVATIAVVVAAVTACTSTDAATTTSHPAAAPRTTSGMVMPDGSTMGVQRASIPSAQARLVCSDDARKDIAQSLSLAALPMPRATWKPPTYTCRYRLPAGLLTLIVTESSNDAAAKANATQVRTGLGTTHPVAGLTDTAFATDTGEVVLAKDSDTLTVDATGLPSQFGKDSQRRNDFAYEVASVILGCWTGD